MRIFVTGGNGFIGSRVVRQLCAAGHEVRLLLRPASKTHRIDGLPWERVPGDLGDAAALRAGMDGVDGVVHLASVSSWAQIRSPVMRTVVLDGTAAVLAAARAAGGPRVVYVSTVAAVNGTRRPEWMTEETAFKLPPEPFVYATAKHAAEEMCRAAAAEGLPVVIVNPCEVYGPEDDDFITASYLRDALRDWPALATSGGTALAHVEDVAAGIVAALTRGRSGERYILGGENRSVRQIVELALEAGGQSGKLVVQPPRALLVGAVGLLARLGLPTPVDPDLLAHAVLYWYVDSAKAQAELGYTFRPARETVQSVVDWLIAAGHVPRPA
jgi:dihydroflavonol-4-reductase